MNPLLLLIISAIIGAIIGIFVVIITGKKNRKSKKWLSVISAVVVIFVLTAAILVPKMAQHKMVRCTKQPLFARNGSFLEEERLILFNGFIVFLESGPIHLDASKTIFATSKRPWLWTDEYEARILFWTDKTYRYTICLPEEVWEELGLLEYVEYDFETDILV